MKILKEILLTLLLSGVMVSWLLFGTIYFGETISVGSFLLTGIIIAFLKH